MKTIYINKLILLFTMFFGIANSYSQISKAEIVATGLTCSMCSNSINKQLKAMPEVEKVMIDLNNQTFVVNLKKDSLITPEMLKKSIEKTGFFVGSMILTMNLQNSEVKDNSSFKNASGTYVFVNPVDKAVTEPLKLKVLNSGFVTKKEYRKSAKTLAKYVGFGASENTYFVKTI